MSLSEQYEIAAALDGRFAFLEEPDRSIRVDQNRAALSGPLSGLLVGVKSNIAVADQVWSAGLRARGEVLASQDAQVVSRLSQAGARFLSCLTMDEAALGAATEASGRRATCNPAAPGRSVGGSSGGSAAAVASGAVRVALGSDTLGSVRIPAAYCGVLGLKPTRDLLPMQGVFPLAPEFDTVGLLADGTEVIHRVLDVFGVPSAKPMEVIAALPEAASTCAPEVGQALDQVQACFKEEGAWAGTRKITGWNARDVRIAAYSLLCVRAADTLKAETLEGQAACQALRFGARLTRADVLNAQAVCDRAVDGLREALSDNVVLVTPTTPEPAFPRGARAPASQADFTAIANLAGVPALAVPISGHPLPISVQFIGPEGSERLLLSLADTLLAADRVRQTPA